METEGRALSDGEVGDQPDQIPSEYRIERRTEMEKTENVRMRGLTPFAALLASATYFSYYQSVVWRQPNVCGPQGL